MNTTNKSLEMKITTTSKTLIAAINLKSPSLPMLIAPLASVQPTTTTPTKAMPISTSTVNSSNLINPTFYQSPLIIGDEISPEELEVYNQNLKMYYRDYLQIEVTILYFLMIFGAATNAYALREIIFRAHHKTGSNILLLNLIIVDLFVILFAVVPELIWCHSISWNTGQFTCKLSQTLKYFSLFSSSFMVVCISYNRYYLLKEPHIFQKEKQRAYRMIKITYISSLVLSIPQLIIHEVVPHPAHNFNQCVGFMFFREKWQLRAYNFYALMGMYLIPLKLIILLYSRIIASLNLDKYVVARMSKSASSEERLSQKTNCMLKTKRKAISTFLAVTISFTVCWTPYAFIQLWQVFSGQEELINPIVTSLMYMFSLFPSCLNPIVNLSHTFRRMFTFKRSTATCPMVRRLRPLRGRPNGSDLKPINYSNDKVHMMR